MKLVFKQITKYASLLSALIILIDAYLTNQFNIEGVVGFEFLD